MIQTDQSGAAQRNVLSGKKVVVSAAGQGIGRACAELFAAAGAEVWATDISEELLSSLRGTGLHTKVVDGTDGAAVTHYFGQLGHVDAVVHCVGYVHNGTMLDCDEQAWRRSFSINVDSFYYTLQAALPHMLAARAGSIVCIASVASSIKGLPNRAAYGATKAAMIGMVKSAAADFSYAGVRINAVCPGTISSPSLEQRVHQLGETVGSQEEARRAFLSRQPLGRIGTTGEVAALCRYLISDEGAFVTGQAISIDGGITI